MRVLGYHVGTNMIANSDGDVCAKASFIDFLLQVKPNTIKVFYYMGQDVANLVKLSNFNQKEVELLVSSNSAKVNLPPYKMRYVKDRFLNLQKGFYGNAPF